MIDSRRIQDLHPVVAKLCKQLIINCKKKGVTIITTSTLRDDEKQASLYALGRTKPGIIVTNCRKVGAHRGYAFDVVPIVNKTCVWNDRKLWNIIGKEGRALGLTWGGDWSSFPDRPHFEYCEGLKYKDLIAGKRPSFDKRKG